MKPLTENLRQWLWFAVLWCGGLLSVAVISAITRWIVLVGKTT